MKRYIKSATTSDLYTTGISFDFISEGKIYPETKIKHDLTQALNDLGYDVLGVDFRDVDYSNYSDYANQNDNISQCGIDFTHFGEYSENQLTETIDLVLSEWGCELIGIDFYSAD